MWCSTLRSTIVRVDWPFFFVRPSLRGIVAPTYCYSSSVWRSGCFVSTVWIDDYINNSPSTPFTLKKYEQCSNWRKRILIGHLCTNNLIFYVYTTQKLKCVAFDLLSSSYNIVQGPMQLQLTHTTWNSNFYMISFLILKAGISFFSLRIMASFLFWA